MEPIKFWKTDGEWGVFSNFARTPIEENGITYKTTEHYFQSKNSKMKKIEMMSFMLQLRILLLR